MISKFLLTEYKYLYLNIIIILWHQIYINRWIIQYSNSLLFFISLLSFGHCIITQTLATFHCIQNTRAEDLRPQLDDLMIRLGFDQSFGGDFSLVRVITEVSTCYSKIVSAPQILVSDGSGAGWIFCREGVLVCKINGWFYLFVSN